MLQPTAIVPLASLITMSSSSSRKKRSSSSSTPPLFKRGDRVEISSNDKGFEGSYYLANVIAWIMDDEYIIQYRTLLNDDGFGPLREVVSADHIRPVPTEIPATEFSSGDVVDAYDKDGWWIGEIIGESGSNYFVCFEDAGEENAYPLSLLRVHQEWVDGHWVPSKRAKKAKK